MLDTWQMSQERMQHILSSSQVNEGTRKKYSMFTPGSKTQGYSFGSTQGYQVTKGDSAISSLMASSRKLPENNLRGGVLC